MLTVNDIAALNTLPSYDRSNPVERQAFIDAFDAWLVSTGRVWYVASDNAIESFDLYDAMDDFLSVCDARESLGTADTYIPSVSDATVALPHEEIGTVVVTL